MQSTQNAFNKDRLDMIKRFVAIREKQGKMPHRTPTDIGGEISAENLEYLRQNGLVQDGSGEVIILRTHVENEKKPGKTKPNPALWRPYNIAKRKLWQRFYTQPSVDEIVGYMRTNVLVLQPRFSISDVEKYVTDNS